MPKCSQSVLVSASTHVLDNLLSRSTAALPVSPRPSSAQAVRYPVFRHVTFARDWNGVPARWRVLGEAGLDTKVPHVYGKFPHDRVTKNRGRVAPARHHRWKAFRRLHHGACKRFRLNAIGIYTSYLVQALGSRDAAGQTCSADHERLVAGSPRRKPRSLSNG
jgi:hypothetical protein